MEMTTPAQLLKLAIVKLSDGDPECALVFALKAVNFAAAHRDDEARRRALNIASGCCVMAGIYADAIDYGLQSASLARALNRDDALVNALLNVTAALTHIGRFEEAIEIAQRAAVRFANSEDCREDTRQLLTNAAGAHLSAQDFGDAICLSQQAIALHGEVNDEHSARLRLIDEFNWMKAAISLDEPAAVAERMKLIEQIAVAYPTLHHQHNLQFANALYAHYFAGQTDAAISELETLVDATVGFSTIQVDALQWLIRLSEFGNDLPRISRYRRLLSEHTHAAKATRVQRALALVSSGQVTEVDVNSSSTERRVEQLLEGAGAESRVNPVRATACLTRDEQLAIERIAVSVQVVDDLTGLSIYRIGKLASLIADAMGYRALESRALECATRLYPIGSDALLTAHGRHPALQLAASIAQNHREHWNGYGKPRQLSGHAIAEAARIASLAIAYDQLTHQGTLTHAEAVQHIKAHAGQQFDPELVAAFLPIIEQLQQHHGKRLDRYLAACAPPREDARHAHATLCDLIPGLTLFEEA